MTEHTDKERLELDAKRYRWLRSQHWEDNTMAVAQFPEQLPAGIQCIALELLDSAIDQAMNKDKQ